MSDYLDPNNEELLKDFFSEAFMQVEAMEQNILALEDDPGDKDAVDEIFRAAHTLKGGAATVQMNELSSFTHLLEDLLDEIRSGNVKVTEENVDVLLSSVDVIKSMVASRQNGAVYEEDYSGVSANLQLMIAKKNGLADPKETPDVKLSHFELADKTGRWHSAEAVIHGPSVTVRSNNLKQPVAVRTPRRHIMGSHQRWRTQSV